VFDKLINCWSNGTLRTRVDAGFVSISASIKPKTLRKREANIKFRKKQNRSW